MSIECHHHNLLSPHINPQTQDLTKTPSVQLVATMTPARLVLRSMRPTCTLARPLRTTTARHYASEREHDTTPAHREIQKNKPLGPHLTNTNSTIANEMPSVGADKAPPELLSSVDPDFVPKDSVPENTEKMTGGTQERKSDSTTGSKPAELEVGEMEESDIKVEPLRRTGEDGNTMRARLLCPSYLSIPASTTLLQPYPTIAPNPLHPQPCETQNKPNH